MAGQVVDTEKYKYNRIKVRGPDGKAHYTASNKDAIAKLLFGMNKQQLAGVAKENSLDMKSHYDLRNVGHYRMILGQALRNLILNKKQELLIGGVTVADLDQKVKWPEGYTEEPKGTHDQPIRKGKASTSRIKA